MAKGRDWAPLAPEEVAAVAPPFVSTGYLSLDKQALQQVLSGLAGREDGGRDAIVLLFLLSHAHFSVPQKKHPYEGTVVGTDTALAALAGMDRRKFARATKSLLAARYIEAVGGTGPLRGYRIRREVWHWLQHTGKDKPKRPVGVGDDADPFRGA